MSNSNDSNFIREMLNLPDSMRFDFFAINAYTISDDSNYWNVLGTLWKDCGSVINQDAWLSLFRSKRRNRHKIMKGRERKYWRKLPEKIIAYRAVNHANESYSAISWTLSKKVADHFSEQGKRLVICREFHKKDVFAYFDRRKEQEILVNITSANT